MSSGGTAGLAPRIAARRLLDGVLARHEPISDQVASGDGPLAGLDGPGRARAQGIATGVLRRLAAVDAALKPHLRKPPPGPVLNTLRVAVWEAGADGIPPHAAVDAAVAAVRRIRKHAHLSGLVNAVARRAAHPPLPDTDPAAALPRWIAKPVGRAYGAQAMQAIAAAHAEEPPLDLTPRDPAGAAELAGLLDGRLMPTGSIRLRRPGQVSALPGYADGAWWVQDAAAALPVRLLGDVSGRRVLDLCAAPGGKTLQLAAAGARVTAVDASADRLQRLRENLARTRLVADIVAADALSWQPPGKVDAILVDAPCSATGTLRRHPDIPHVRPDPDLRPLLDLQARLIDRAVEWLAPGGRLVFCTCSLLPAEGEAQAIAALDRHRILARAPRPDLPGVEPAWWTAEGDLRLRPDYWAAEGGMDGFFATALIRDERPA